MRKNYFLKSILVMITVLVGGAFSSASAQYCTSAATYTGDTEINVVSITGANMNINNSNINGCTGYTDFTATDTADMILGGTYAGSVLTGTCNGGTHYARMFKVFVDWNQDQDFDDLGEEVFIGASTPYGTIPSAQTFNVAVPATALPGYTRMRVVCRESGSVASTVACGSYSWGETNDYTLQVRGYGNDIGLVALTNPTFPTCAMDSVVKVSIMNSGNLPLTSATVNWSVNGTLQAPFSVTSTLASFAMDTLTLGTVAGGLNDGDVVSVWASMANGLSPDSNTANDSLSATLFNSLAGVYLIDPAGNGDFLTFNEATAAMSSFGICGPTIIEAVDSTYIEQIELEQYTGMSNVNTVTFRSQSGNRDNVTLSYAATGSADNHVVKGFNTPYFSFENMSFTALGATYGYVFNLWASDSISINNCNVTCVSTGSQAYPIRSYYYNNGNYGSAHDFTLTNSTLTGGYYSLYYYNYSQDPANDGVIENNEFINPYYRAVYAYYAKDLQFNNNHVISNSTYTSAYAFYLYQITGGSISNNFVEGTTSWPRYGMYLGYCQGDLSTFMPIVGNRVSLPSSSAQYGMYAYQNLFSELAHNSIYMAGSNSYGMYFSSGSYNKAKNNIIQLSGGGYGMYLNGSPLYQSDYNNISTPNTANAGYMGGAQASLADWQLATGFDSNSISVNMVYTDTASLKVCTDSLYGMGESLPMYMYDFEGDMRQTMPCIGADEFMPISEFGFNVNPVLCNGDTLTLTQGYYDTVVWNTTDTTNSYAIYAPGTQTVSVYDACGSDTSVFNVDAQIMAAIGDTNLCEGTTADLGTGISGGSYLWSNGSTDSTINVATAGTVSVQVMDAHGCESADTAVVTASFDVVLPDSSTFCEGSSVVLDANMTGTYVWSDGSSNQTLAVTASGVYSVTVTDQNCISTSMSNVSEILDAVPSFTDWSSYLTVAFTNGSANATSYLWNFGDGTTSTDENPIHIYPWTPEDSTCYTVVLTATNSCGSVDYTETCVRAGQMVSVSELELANMVNVYPNPNNGLFNVSVKTDDTQDMSVEVMDVRGAVVFTQSYGQVTGEINREVNVANSAAGIYFVKVTLDSETAVYRISVK